MPAAKLPDNEQERLLALKRLNVLDTHAEAEFDAIAQAASLTCGVPISLISLVDQNRQWFKANIGLAHVKETPRELAFCAHAILGNKILEVEDATHDPRFADNPIVLGAPNIRFYAGVPLKLTTGENVGTLCVIDSKPHLLTDQQRAILTSLATAASHALENHRLRVSERAILTAEQALLEAADYTASIFRNTKDPIIALMLDGTVTHWNGAAQKLFGLSQDEMLGENISRLVPTEHTHQELQRIMHIAEAPNGVAYETKRLSKTGELIDVAVSLAPLYNGAGRLIGATKIVHDIREEVLIRGLLATNESKYRALSESSPLGVFATDVTGACTYTNQRCRDIFGLNLEDSLGHGWHKTTHPLDREKVFSEWQRAASARVEFDMEFSVRHANSVIHFVHVRARPTFDEQDNITGFVGTVEDITEQRNTQERLASSEERYRKLYNNSPVMMQTIDAQGRLSSVNNYWLEKHGYTREEVLGRHTAEFHTPESAQYARDVVIPMVWKAGFCENIAYQRVKKNGEVFDVSLSAYLERDSDGNPLRSMAVLVDVTAENLAKRATEELLGVIRTQFIYSVTDSRGTILEVNDAFCAISQYTREELIGANHRLINSGVHPKSFIKEIWDTIQAGENWHGEICNRTKNGSLYWVNTVISPLHNVSGEIDRYISILTDITERKLAEHALLEQKNHIQQIVENHNTATFMINTHHKVTHWNKRCEELTGVKATDILGQPAWHGFYHKERPTLSDLVLSDHREQASAFYAKSFPSDLSDKGWLVESWLEELKHGEKRYVSAEAAKILDTEGNPIGVIQTITDMTQYKYAEMALLTQKNQMHQMLDNQSVASFMIDTNHKVTHWNKACALLTGVDEQTILGQESWLGFYPQAQPCLADMVLNNQQILAEKYYALNRASTLIKTGWHAENWFDNLGGKKRYLIFDAAPIYDEQGFIIAVIQTLQDTTESKLAETALSEERQYLSSVIEGTQAGTWQWNVSTGEAHFKEFWATILGYTSKDIDKLSGSPVETWRMLLHPDDSTSARRALSAHFNKKTSQYEAEFRMRHKDGHWVWILSRGRIFTWLNDCTPEWMYGTHLDITELKSQQEALALANERVKIATQSGGIGIWSYDVVNNILECDSTIKALYGLSENEVMTIERWNSMLHPDDREDTVLAFEESIVGEREYDVEFRAIWKDGSTHYIRAKASITRNDKGKALYMLGTNWDITLLKKLTIEFAKQHEVLRVTLQSIGDGVITTDPKGRITWLNPVAERMTGWLAHEAKNKPLNQVFNIISQVTRKVSENSVKQCLKHGKVSGLKNHTILISKDGREYGIEDSASPIRAEDGNIIGAVLVFHDVTEQRRLSNEMSYRATHDPLTGLINRAEFEVCLTRSLNLAKTEACSHILMFIDLDQFKLVNDACGHTSGDILLQQVSKILLETVRSSDIIARLGGDEFAVILEHCTTEQAQRVAQTICDRMDEYRFIHDSKRFRIGTSIGLAVLDGRWVNITHAIQAADAACYTAKEAGRNRVHTWFDTDASMQLHQGEMKWATRLEIAMDENQFELYAQRIGAACLNESEIAQGIHAEILLRLRAPNGEIIAPGIFLPAAERFHLASRIDRWVLSTVIAWLESLTDINMVNTLCINLSGQSIGDRAFHSHALTQLKTAGKQICQRICLEITETVMITNIVDASIFIEQVRQLGVRIALDDFGAGASSFGYLKNMNVDILKIDGQFIKGMLEDPLDESAVRCFVDVARIAGLKTIADYVESQEVLHHVRRLGIHYAQGYLIHQPAPLNLILADAGNHTAETI